MRTYYPVLSSHPKQVWHWLKRVFCSYCDSQQEVDSVKVTMSPFKKHIGQPNEILCILNHDSSVQVKTINPKGWELFNLQVHYTESRVSAVNKIPRFREFSPGVKIKRK